MCQGYSGTITGTRCQLLCIVWLIAHTSGHQLLLTTLKRHGILTGTKLVVQKLPKYQHLCETDCCPVVIIAEATSFCSTDRQTQRRNLPVFDYQLKTTDTQESTDTLEIFTQNSQCNPWYHRTQQEINMDNAEPSNNTSDCKPSTEELLQQATGIR